MAMLWDKLWWSDNMLCLTSMKCSRNELTNDPDWNGSILGTITDHRETIWVNNGVDVNFCVLFCFFLFVWIFDECECTIHLYHQLMSITWTYHDPHGSIGCFQHVPSASPTMQLGGREDSTRPAKQGFASQGWWIGIPEIISQGDSKFTIYI